MPAFAYQAVDTTGKRLRGRGEAGSPELLTRSLEQRGMLVLDVAPSEQPAGPRLGLHFGRQQAGLEAPPPPAALLPARMPPAPALAGAPPLTPGPLTAPLDA